MKKAQNMKTETKNLRNINNLCNATDLQLKIIGLKMEKRLFQTN